MAYANEQSFSRAFIGQLIMLQVCYAINVLVEKAVYSTLAAVYILM